ncbi:MAG: HAMP domain-containing sensor histidine kinase [Kiritimatiellae bacterium]|jgi:signal transduction histidine kinase|nr:HAMP domain-containing sensor histidine kinase [Kiritimatiellia bacterium]
MRRVLDLFSPLLKADLSDEEARVSQLIIGFSIVGGLFSILYAVFYLAIQHYAGAGIILSHSLIFSTVPFVLLRKRNIPGAGHAFLASLLSMFTLLSIIEGGVNGHAVAWLSAFPVCAPLVLAGGRSALAWCGVCVFLVSVFAGLEVVGLHLPITYPNPWHGWVTLTGYAGLALFLMALGTLAEYYRRAAMRQRDLAQQELKKAVEKLTLLNQEKNEFLGIAAHDLNNPLTVVQGYADMLKMMDNSENLDEVREFAGLISDSSRRMQQIIRDILDVNKIESGQYPLKPAHQEMRPVVEACIRRYQPPGKQKDLHWKIHLDDVNALFDANALSQVLDNLISNAVKYARPGGNVEIRLKRDGETALIRVFNEGRGFSPEDKQRLFTRFAKLSTRPSGGESSNGLGLSITKKIVQAMDGSIQCESELDQGATFDVRLPL